MPFYSFECDSCKKDLEMFCTFSGLGQATTNTGSLKDSCVCGGELKRKFLNINLGPDIYKNDPNSNQFWKRGKTQAEIAGVLSDDNSAPY
jgi:predicted nucleic acid-binding Zn ribbon protein